MTVLSLGLPGSSVSLRGCRARTRCSTSCSMCCHGTARRSRCTTGSSSSLAARPAGRSTLASTCPHRHDGGDHQRAILRLDRRGVVQPLLRRQRQRRLARRSGAPRSFRRSRPDRIDGASPAVPHQARGRSQPSSESGLDVDAAASRWARAGRSSSALRHGWRYAGLRRSDRTRRSRWRHGGRASCVRRIDWGG
jgi:hypothetical protein